MRMTRTVLTLLLLPAWAGVQAAAKTASLETAPVAMQSVVQEEEFDAVVEAVNQSTVSSQTTGRVTEVNFDVDDYVTKGSVLLRIHSNDQRAAVSAAQARLAEAKASYARMKELYAKNLIARAMYDQAQANYKSAAADAVQAREGLGNTVVRAPYSGIVVERHIQVGEMAKPGQPLMTGFSLDALRVTASVPQQFINSVRQLSRARIILPNGESVSGGKLTISPYADPQSHTFKVRVELPKDLSSMYPGEFAKVAFATGEDKRLVVPTRAVVHRSEVTAVYVVKPDGRISFRQIRLGDPFGENVEVLAGLTAGEKIALDPIRAGIALKKMRAGSGS